MADQALSRTVTVANHEGIHLRAASLLVNLARRFESSISIAKGDRTADAKSTPLQLLGLGAKQGEVLLLKATGGDAGEALDALVQLFATGFDEHSEDDQEEVSQVPSTERGTPDDDAAP